MSEQLWKYLPHIPQPVKKVNPLKRRSQITDKQVLNLTGGLFPIKLVQGAQTNNPKEQQNRANISLGKIRIIKKLYHGQKFNVDPDIPQFDQIQYNSLGLSQWKYQTVSQIFQLMKNFNLNFIVVYDRISDSSLTIQDIKEFIKKQQREQINLKKILKLDQIPQQNFQLQKENPQIQVHKKRKVYTRQQYLMSPLKLPGKVYERLVQVLIGMNIPQKIIATQQNTQLYDKLRQKILLMFSIQRYIKKKQNQRRLLEERKKKMATQQEDQKKNPLKNIDPKKKINPNPIKPA